jgi:transposase, IS5 family
MLEVCVLTLWAAQVESLWDESLPVEVRELPADLAELDRVLSDPELMMVLVERWRQEVVETGRAVLWDGRPTIAMETYVRLMVLKVRYRWGYRSLVAEVSDSIHLRRFCRISLGERVPDESTVRKLTRRIGAETVNELTRSLIETALRQKRFRPRAVRIDSTVIEADVRYPTDADLASHGVRVLAREGRKLAGVVREKKARVRDRSRSVGRRLRALTRTVRRRTGEAKAEVLALTEQTGELLQRSITEARKLAALARRRALGRGAATKRNAAAQLEELADRCEKVATQIRQRVAGKPIADRLVSIADPDARPIRKGKLGKPNEFGYVSQICEVTEHTRGGARGLIVPASTRLGNPAEDTLLPDTLGELTRLGIQPREIALDGGFNPGPTHQALADHGLTPERVFIAGRQQPGSRRTRRRLQRYRTGAEGRISHLKRGYGLDRSRLKGDQGRQMSTGWAVLAYNADTLAVRAR